VPSRNCRPDRRLRRADLHIRRDRIVHREHPIIMQIRGRRRSDLPDPRRLRIRQTGMVDGGIDLVGPTAALVPDDRRHRTLLIRGQRLRQLTRRVSHLPTQQPRRNQLPADRRPRRIHPSRHRLIHRLHTIQRRHPRISRQGARTENAHPAQNRRLPSQNPIPQRQRRQRTDSRHLRRRPNPLHTTTRSTQRPASQRTLPRHIRPRTKNARQRPSDHRRRARIRNRRTHRILAVLLLRLIPIPMPHLAAHHRRRPASTRRHAGRASQHDEQSQ
jgi:hypothetical protein